MNTVKFQVNEVQDLAELTESDYYKNHDPESLNLFLDAVFDFAGQALYPYFREMDAEPARWESGQIKTHAQIGAAIKQGAELGLIAAPIEEQHGGLQLPFTVHTAAYAILEAANNHVPGYLGLTLGAAELILLFGNESLKEKYAQKMLEGTWCGTMCLTEPQAGSSLSDISTTAYPTTDGLYRISGQKIFISGGDHQHADNIIHLVLARIAGAPAGTRGISLFVVPKNRQDTQGKWVSNDVITAGDFQKMGQKGYCTTHLIFGEQNDCQGWLVGEANRGLAYMFQMMNGARIAVGRGAASIALAAYQASLAYARERYQGRPISDSGKKDLTTNQIPIIEHPDVRRMLYLQKAIAEGSLSLVLQAAFYLDKMKTATSPEEKMHFHLLLELLTPVGKTYPSEMGIMAVSQGLQVLGGYGFCEDYILQQYYRDIRIFSIYEGTTGIQSLDLLGRKMLMQNGEALVRITSEIKKTVDAATNSKELLAAAAELNKHLLEINQTTSHLQRFIKENDFERYLADATIYMDMFSTIVVAWQWLKMAVVAKKNMDQSGAPFTRAFYQSKIHTMEFFFKYELPKATSLARILANDKDLTLPGQDYF